MKQVKLSNEDYKQVLDIVYNLAIKEAQKVSKVYEDYCSDIFLNMSEEERYGLEMELGYYGAYKRTDLPQGYEEYYSLELSILDFTVQLLFLHSELKDSLALCQLFILDNHNAIRATYTFEQ
jgi:hypothetical protein